MGLFSGISKGVKSLVGGGSGAGILGGLTGGLSKVPVIGDIFGGAASAYGTYQQQQSSEKMVEKQMDFQAEQGQIARDYTTDMSNTAVQRNIADMRNAGLNPILAAGQGASTPSSPAMGGAKGEAQNPELAGLNAALAVKMQKEQIENLKATRSLTETQEMKASAERALTSLMYNANLGNEARSVQEEAFYRKNPNFYEIEKYASLIGSTSKDLLQMFSRLGRNSPIPRKGIR